MTMRNKKRNVSYLAAIVLAAGLCAADSASSGSAAADVLRVDFETVVSIDPASAENTVGFELLILGRRPSGDLQVFLGEVPGRISKISQPDRAGRSKVNVYFVLSGEQREPMDLRIEEGNHVHIRKSAVRVVPKPQFNGVTCGTRQEPLDLPAGEPFSFTVTQLPVAGLRISLDGEELPIAELDDGRAQIILPPSKSGKGKLEISTEVPGFGTMSLCEEAVRIVEAGPRCDEMTLSYEPSGRKIRLRAKGRKLPPRFTATLTVKGEKNPLETALRSEEGDESRRVYLGDLKQAPGLGRFAVFAGRDGKQEFCTAQGTWISDGASEWQWRSVASELEADLFAIYEDSHQGTVVLGGAALGLVRVSKETFPIGLTPEQQGNPILVQSNLAAASSDRKGVIEVPLVRPFLIGTTEVTQAQFMAYVEAAAPPEREIPVALRSYRGRALPPELAALPVTGVSFVAVRRYVGWLRDELAAPSPRWQVRLPHELEWEMAARGSKDRSYAFQDDDEQRGLESLREKTIRPVGTNPWDRSDCGSRDMTGNVREWTETVYDEKMLSLLHLHLGLGSLEDGWDPAHPGAIPNLFEELPEDLRQISRNVTVRGGANGEHPVYLQLSVRRQMEITDAAPNVGFRLLLVPRDDP